MRLGWEGTQAADQPVALQSIADVSRRFQRLEGGIDWIPGRSYYRDEPQALLPKSPSCEQQQDEQYTLQRLSPPRPESGNDRLCLHSDGIHVRVLLSAYTHVAPCSRACMCRQT